ncbi:MAG: hypothetical protein K8S14_11035 [Actinomycetia bacterium]|nr:hypothetical protein [Actinomycetes bacterium]
MKRDFDSITPEQRNLILVASDEKYHELTSLIDFRKLLLLLLFPTANLWVAVLSPFLLSSFTATTLAGIGVTGKRGFRQLFRKGEIPIPHLSPSEATDRFGFDHGHPQDGMAYLLDATRSYYYLVPAIANERLAQEKVAAFLELSSALGSKKLELVSAELLEQTMKGKTDIPLKQVGAQIGIDASFGIKDELNRKVYSEFEKPSNAPYIPDKVVRWLDVDPMFRSMASTRLNGTLLRTRVSLNISSTIDIGAKALAAIKSFKVSVGGEYHKVVRSSWSFEIEFWPKDD